jgi:hypothetical protein
MKTFIVIMKNFGLAVESEEYNVIKKPIRNSCANLSFSRIDHWKSSGDPDRLALVPNVTKACDGCWCTSDLGSVTSDKRQAKMLALLFPR